MRIQAERKNYSYWNRYLYTLFVVQCLGMVISKYSPINKSVVLWTIGLIGMLVLVWKLLRRCNVASVEIVTIGFIMFTTQAVSVILYSSHAFDSIKSLGININLLSILLFTITFAIADNPQNTIDLDEENDLLWKIFKCSFIVIVLCLFLDSNQFIRSFNSSLNAYSSAWNGVFPNKNMLGSFTALGLANGVYQFYCRNNKKQVILMCFIFFVVLIVSFCRAALLFFCCFVFFFIIFRSVNEKMSEKHLRNANRMFVFFFFIILFTLVILLLSNSNVLHFIEQKVLRLDVGTAGRNSIQKYVIEMMKEKGIGSWLFGIGYSELNYESSHDCHNIYLYTFATGGILKVFNMLLLFLFAVKNIKKNQHEIITDFSNSILLAYLIFAFFETNELFELGLVNYIFFVYIFLLPALLKTDHRSHCEQDVC